MIRPPRPCLKNVNMPKRRVFFRHTALIFLQYTKYCCVKSPCLAKKSLAVGHISNFQTRPNRLIPDRRNPHGLSLDRRTKEDRRRPGRGAAGVRRRRVGKTRVLVERLLDRVTREGLDLDRFLVITYTKAAARRTAHPHRPGALLPPGGEPRGPAPAAAVHPGVPGPDLHHPLLLLRPPAGGGPPAGPGPGLPGCATRGRPRCSWPRCWRTCWRSSMRASSRTAPLPSWWTPCPPGGTTAAWPRSCWTCSAASRATPTRSAG